MLSRILMWTFSNIRAYNRLFPIVDLRYVFTHFKAEKMPSLSSFVVSESKSNLTIFPISLFKNLLFCDISCNFLLMVLIKIVSFFPGSNKLANSFNCDPGLQMPMSSLFISNKKVLSCNWLSTNINFWSRHKLNIWISGALFEKNVFSFDNLIHVLFEQKVNSFIKIR